MKSMKKTIAALVAIAMVFGCVVGGTIAWLVAGSDTLTNTFTVGNIDITLAETTGNEYKMIPGKTVEKDPTVTVDGSSEDCWLFVKVEEQAATLVETDGTTSEKTLDYFISYDMATGWIPLEDESGVYYREAKANDSFPVLANNEVEINQAVVKADMDALERTGAKLPELVFTAYAVQKEEMPSAAAAWAAVSNPTGETPAGE